MLVNASHRRSRRDLLKRNGFIDQLSNSRVWGYTALTSSPHDLPVKPLRTDFVSLRIIALLRFGFIEMTSSQNAAQKSAAPNGARDLISRLYREIGISAVAAALEATARKPQKSPPNRKDIPAVLRDEEAA